MRKIPSLKGRLKRYQQIGNVLIKYGFGVILERIHLSRILKISSRERRKEKELFPLPVRVRMMCEELGPTFIKLGQILSVRPDLIPLSFIKEFEKLQDKVPPVETEKIEKVITEELGSSLENLFSSFERKPLAAASIAQVHRASLQNGEEIILKVQRPGIDRVIHADIQILHNLASLMERFIEEAKIYEPVKIVNEFERTINKELDFILEARNIKRFSQNFRSDETVSIPRVYQDFTTRKVLSLQYVEGIKIKEVERLEKAGLDRKKIALNGARAVLKQIFKDGFFHGDPHPGNILVLEDGRICYLDFGIVGKLNERKRGELASLLIAFLKREPEGIIRNLLSMKLVSDEINLSDLEREIDEIMDRYYEVPIKEVRMGEVISEGLNVMHRFEVKIPVDLSLLIKALITTEGVGLLLDPDFNLTSEIKPFATSLIRERLNPLHITKDLIQTIPRFYSLMKNLPAGLEVFIRNIKKGYLNIAFEHKGLKNFTTTINKSSNRISFSLIISALLIGSSLIMISEKGPLFLGFSVLGISGFILSAILGLWLVFSIIKGGKL